MALSQRPLTLGEILDHTVQLYRRNFLLLAGIAALPAGAMVIGFGTLGLFLNSELGAAKGSDATILITVTVTLILLVGVPLMVAVFALAMSASGYGALCVHQGQKTTIRGAYRYGFGHFWRHLWLLILQGLLAAVVPYLVFLAIFTLGGILAALATKSGMVEIFGPIFAVLAIALVIGLFVAGVWIWLRYSLAFPASVTEDAPAWPAMKRSAVLTKGTRGRIFVMFLLVGALSGLISLVLMIPAIILVTLGTRESFNGTPPSTTFVLLFYVINFGISFLVRAAVIPVYAVALQVFYFDQRTRQEGYDIELLMAQAGWANLPPVEVAAVVVEAVEFQSPVGAEAGEAAGEVVELPPGLAAESEAHLE